jgi:hypothetical protein
MSQPVYPIAPVTLTRSQQLAELQERFLALAEQAQRVAASQRATNPPAANPPTSFNGQLPAFSQAFAMDGNLGLPVTAAQALLNPASL